MIYVGANDGMLHAINDCDGSEAWAFISPDVLPYLQYLKGDTHAYFTDSTIFSYVYDANKNGTIDLNDKVIILFGLQRGGGRDSAPTTGFYYALDVTDPAAPVFLWKLSNASTGFTNMAEAWSDPKIVKAQIGTDNKVIMLIGGGYDNCHEDARYGATQTFSGSCVSAIATSDGGLDSSNNPKTSTGTTVAGSLVSRKGHRLYAVEVATLDASSVPNFTSSGTRLWINTSFDYSVATEVTAIDSNYDGYVDRIYMGDTGGNLWRANISSTDTTDWTVTKIFSSNPGYANGAADGSTGRKLFYKPSAFVDTNGIVRLYFGTGDREHPLNRGVADRLYEVIDKGQTSAITEAKLVDVTTDQIQTSTTTASGESFYNTAANGVTLSQASNAADTTTYGWYIRLDGQDRSPAVAWPGEKMLAPATLYNKVVYYTTYSPNTAAVTDPCAIGNLGTGLLYAVDYETGNSVFNYDLSNDTQYGIYQYNTASVTGGSGVILRTDRHVKLGAGIPSGIVVTGDRAFIGCGGGICSTTTTPGGQVLPLYWRQR